MVSKLKFLFLGSLGRRCLDVSKTPTSNGWSRTSKFYYLEPSQNDGGGPPVFNIADKKKSKHIIHSFHKMTRPYYNFFFFFLKGRFRGMQQHESNLPVSTRQAL